MITLKIDHFDTQYAYCTDREKKIYALLLEEIPKTAKKGDILQIDENGGISVKK